MNTTKHPRRALVRGAAATGLLAALALPALAGTAHADGGTQPRHLASTEPSAAPSAAPGKPGERAKPAPGTPPAKAPSEARSEGAPSAAPAPSTRQDELAHTGSPKTNTALAAGAGALIAAGAGTVYSVRRRQNH